MEVQFLLQNFEKDIFMFRNFAIIISLAISRCSFEITYCEPHMLIKSNAGIGKNAVSKTFRNKFGTME